MTYDPNANWTAKTNADAHEPIYFLDFEDLDNVRFSSGPIRTIVSGSTYHRVLNVPKGLGQKLSQSKGRSSLSRLIVDLVDVGGIITDLVSGQLISAAFGYTADSSEAESPFPNLPIEDLLTEITGLSTARGQNFQELVHVQGGTLEGKITVDVDAGIDNVPAGLFHSAMTGPDGDVNEKFWPKSNWTVRYTVGTVVSADLEVSAIYIARIDRAKGTATLIGTLKGLTDTLSPAATSYVRTVLGAPTFGNLDDYWAIALVVDNNGASQAQADIDGHASGIDSPMTSGLHRLLNAKATLFSGYSDLDEADYAEVTIMQVQDVAKQSDGVTWRLGLADIKRATQDEIMVNSGATQRAPFRTVLDVAITAGAVTADIQAQEGVSKNDTVIFGPSSAAGFIGDEEIRRLSRQPESLGLGLSSRIFFDDALESDYAIQDQIRWVTAVIEGNPINIIYAILTGDFTNATFPLIEAIGLPTGLGVDPADIDTTDLVAERDTFFENEIWRFEFKNKLTGFKFLESQMFQWMGYSILKGSGKVSFRAYGPVRASIAADGNIPQILKEDVLNWAYKKNTGLHTNRIKVSLDNDVVPGVELPTEFVTVEDTVDQGVTKETRSIEQLKETGFKTSLHGERLAEARLSTVLRRFVNEPTQIAVTCGLKKRALEMGEVIELTHPEIPDEIGGTGITKRRLEIVEKSEDFDADVVKFLFQDPGFTRPGWIAPDSAPDYDAATPAQREFLYIVDDDEDFGDGTPPFEII